MASTPPPPESGGHFWDVVLTGLAALLTAAGFAIPKIVQSIRDALWRRAESKRKDRLLAEREKDRRKPPMNPH